jgi:hypothetical protein
MHLVSCAKTNDENHTANLTTFFDPPTPLPLPLAAALSG